MCIADLSEMGFRRQRRSPVPTALPKLQCLRAARIPVAQFVPDRNQKRILKRNADLTVTAANPRFSEEYFDLYQRYIEQRHADGDMFPPSRDQFSTFLVRELPFSRFYEFRLDGRLLAVAVTDLLPNGLSAVYTFYEPDEERRSPGTLRDPLANQRSPALGTGGGVPWILDQKLQKMNYKTQYRPIELLINQRWVTLN